MGGSVKRNKEISKESERKIPISKNKWAVLEEQKKILQRRQFI